MTWEESDTVKMVVPGLTAGDELAYQVVAMNDAGEVIAVYPKVEFTVGVDPEPEETEPEATEPEATEPEATEPGTEVNPETGDPIVGIVLMLLASASGAVIIKKKNR